MLSRTKQLLFGTHTDFYEFFNAVLLILWGTWLILPFDSLANALAFKIFSNLIPEQIFGLIPVCIGSYLLYTLMRVHPYRSRRVMLLASTFWVFLSIMISVSNIKSVGVVTYAMIALFSAISYLRQ